MKLTIEQALKEGVAAHNEGKLQEAERLYRAILKSQPIHPDANHNLGLIALSTNRTNEALTLFKIAIKTNPKIEQFWISYINVLIKVNQLEVAKQEIKNAKKRGFDIKKLQALLAISNVRVGNKVPSEEKLSKLLEYYQFGQYDDAEKLAISITQEFPEHQFSWKVLGVVLGQTGRIFEAINANQIAIKLAPQDAEAHNNLGNTLKEIGKLEESQASCRQAILLKPNFAEAHNNLGNALKELGKLEESQASYTQAIVLKPNFAEAHSNLGNVLKELGKLEESQASFTQAIVLKPNFAEAHNNLGNVLKELGKLEESQASFTQAIVLKPNFAEAHYNLGITYKELGRFDKACSLYIQAINLNKDFTDAYINLSLVIKNFKFTSSDPKLYPILINILKAENTMRPQDMASCILSLLNHDPLIKDLLTKKYVKNLKEFNSNLEALDKLPLLHHLMRVCPLSDLQFEKFFMIMRSFIIMNLDKIEISPELINFISTLCLQCFINEYAYFESDEEIQLINELETKIKQTIMQSRQPEKIKILCLATYRPLHKYDWSQKLEALDKLKEVKNRLIEEPINEKEILKDIKILGDISNKISCKVRNQYEENPYPRWIKPAIPKKPKLIAEVCNELELHLNSEDIKDVIAPKLLIAGCGTGQHSIEAASYYLDCKVIAVDLSLASLAYAKRKTTELEISNLSYLQADILNLNKLESEFDIIESAGVLHHMDEPMAGWRVLTNLLKTGGLMKIGLYSELARQHIVKVQNEISLMNIGTSETDIRKFRRSLIESSDKNYQLLNTSSDFFNLSTLRDLIFHVKEHRFTLPQIKNCLYELGLKFCGFINKDVILNFRELNGKDANIYDLELWDKYEKINPQSFKGMYQFWCQKI